MHEPINGYHWELLAKYLKDEISDEEKTELFAWVNQSPANRDTFYRSTHLWHVTGTVKTDFRPNVDAAWQQFSTRMKTEPVSPAIPTEQPIEAGGRVVPMYLWRAAAAVTVLIGAVWLVVAWSRQTVGPVTLTAGNSKQIFFLPDSSRVTLNQFSTLTYQPGLDGDERTVKLEGEGFFEVKRNEQKPFVVLTENSRTEVLGTSFTVKSDEAGITEVQVVTGRVAFSARREKGPAQRVILTPGFKAVASAQDSVVKTKIEDPNFRAWQTDRLEFDNTPLNEVITSLGQYFDVTIKVENKKLLGCRFTGSFEQPKLKQVLEVLAESMQVRYNYEGNHYTLSGRGCP